jgi:hypothetical protein
VQSHEAAARLDVATEGCPLCVGVEDVVIRVGEDEEVVPGQVRVGELCGVVGCRQREALFVGHPPEHVHGGLAVVVHVSLAVACVDEGIHLLPSDLCRQGGGDGGGEDEEECEETESFHAGGFVWHV